LGNQNTSTDQRLIGTVKISRIYAEDSRLLDGAENAFTGDEVFDLSFIDGEFQLNLRRVEQFEKSYDADDSSDDEAEAYGAFVDGVLVGKIELASTWNDLASIEHIVVAREFRGRGIASGLIDFAKSWARGKQLKGVRLETQTNNVAACRLYFRSGFEVGGFDRFSYRTQPDVANETALYLYWFPNGVYAG
jgi:streptothricin acetyltransferase